jgi:hypothetical protein
LATRTVTSYLPGGLFMPGTVSVICDILGARWPATANNVADAVAIHRSVPRPATVAIERRTCPWCGGERPDPG